MLVSLCLGDYYQPAISRMMFGVKRPEIVLRRAPVILRTPRGQCFGFHHRVHVFVLFFNPLVVALGSWTEVLLLWSSQRTTTA